MSLISQKQEGKKKQEEDFINRNNLFLKTCFYPRQCKIGDVKIRVLGVATDFLENSMSEYL